VAEASGINAAFDGAVTDFFSGNYANAASLKDGGWLALGFIVAEDRRGGFELAEDSGVPLVVGRKEVKVQADLVHAEDIHLTGDYEVYDLTGLGDAGASGEIANVLEANAQGARGSGGMELIAEGFKVGFIQVAFV
jgi:hypothetical protein